MKKILCCVWIFATAIVAVNCGLLWRQNSRCTGVGELCVRIIDCPEIYDVVKSTLPPLPQHIVNFLRKYHCGVYNGREPMVCCTVPDKSIDIRNTFLSIPENPENHKNLHLLPTKDCGRIASGFRIVGGRETDLNEFPWMAILVTSENGKLVFKCSGTIINNLYILTAAHCVHNQDVVMVILGEHNLNTDPDCDSMNEYCAPEVQEIPVEKVIVHPNYSVSNHTNDIALLRLEYPASFDRENVQPICLPTESDHLTMNLIGRDLTVSGWGVTGNSAQTSTLMKTILRVKPIEVCKRVYSAAINYKQICAGGAKNQDSCSGDSGGPLKYPINFNDDILRYVQYGVVSYGHKTCGLEGIPAIYTNVAYYIDWILETIKP